MRVTVLKLGGSLITEKDRPLTPNTRAIRAAVRAIRLSRLPSASHRLFLVHGGGSFGHYYAKRYDLSSSRFSSVDPKAVSLTSFAMRQLHCIVLSELIRQKVNCRTIEAPDMLDQRGHLSNLGSSLVPLLFETNLIPVSFGDVSVTKGGARIISGDEVCIALARKFDVSRVIFAMDVDGIYPDSSLRGRILSKLDRSSLASLQVKSSPRKFDVTGGVGHKLELAMKLSELGCEVFFLNGNKTERLERCLLGESEIKATKLERGKSF
ncbi:MAG TPA: isopentenyl phosphate kinase [Nitrososphaerales archaeon]|nr:isopentenyl phosphate kinase [Nitrososphaerales archaeon]